MGKVKKFIKCQTDVTTLVTPSTTSQPLAYYPRSLVHKNGSLFAFSFLCGCSFLTWHFPNPFLKSRSCETPICGSRQLNNFYMFSSHFITIDFAKLQETLGLFVLFLNVLLADGDPISQNDVNTQAGKYHLKFKVKLFSKQNCQIYQNRNGKHF